MSTIDNLPPLRDVIHRYELNAKKSLGQNFILDLNITAKIAKTAGQLDGHHVIEVGPGPGGLTRAILAAGAAHLTVIERDQRCIGALKDIQAAYPDRMTILEEDALRVDYKLLTKDGLPTKLIANLPYNIATPLLIGWLTSDDWPPFYESLTLMFQREVAERIVAESGEKHYGRLGVMAGWRTHSNIMFDLGPEIFTPPPKVTSSVVHLSPKAKLIPCEIGNLERITAAAFQQRRKMLRASLKSVFDDPIKTMEDRGIDPTARAETLSIEEFIALANAL